MKVIKKYHLKKEIKEKIKCFSIGLFISVMYIALMWLIAIIENMHI